MRFIIEGVKRTFCLSDFDADLEADDEYTSSLSSEDEYSTNSSSDDGDDSSSSNSCSESTDSSSDFDEELIENANQSLYPGAPITVAESVISILQGGFLEKLTHRFTRTKSDELNYEDICDGLVYKSLPDDFTDNPNNITFTWDSDGFPLFKSSKFSVWPVYLMINELPYQDRKQKKNNIVAGLWCGTSKPLVHLFISPFEQGLQQLYSGVNFQVPNEPGIVKVRGLIACGTCDLPAKALFLNIHQYNGKYGCPSCEIRTE
uniref:Uncharacterized protein n=1 Tax=Trichogramma kaykai TaxID=54128 RepID=A0ABD2XQ09_9HYME